MPEKHDAECQKNVCRLQMHGRCSHVSLLCRSSAIVRWLRGTASAVFHCPEPSWPCSPLDKLFNIVWRDCVTRVWMERARARSAELLARVRVQKRVLASHQTLSEMATRACWNCAKLEKEVVVKVGISSIQLTSGMYGVPGNYILTTTASRAVGISTSDHGSTSGGILAWAGGRPRCACNFAHHHGSGAVRLASPCRWMLLPIDLSS